MTIIAPETRPAPAVPASAHPTLCAAFQATTAAHAEQVALRTPGDGARVTWAEYADHVRDTAARLATLGAILAALDAPEPLRLALGEDAVEAIRGELDRRRADLDGFESVG